jgi:hypothetical protein
VANISRIPTAKSLYEQWVLDQGLSQADILNLGLRLMSQDEAAPLLGFNPSAPCILLPYEPAGTPEYLRVRRLGVTDNKYMSPKGSGCSPVYMPPVGVADWHDVKADPNVPLVLVEGEVKAYWGCKTGGTVVGLGGVQMQATLFDGSWSWKDRIVSICFDHDIGQEPGEYKPGVANALGRLSSSLIERGAKVNVIHLGLVAPNPSRKYGLDDYLREVGASGWGELFATASPPPEWCSMLADMLDSCVYVVGTNHVHVYNLLNKSRKSPADFHDTHIEKKRIVPGEPGKRPREVQISRTWIEHPGRITVDDYDLNPRLPFGVQGDKINLWEGYPVWNLGSPDKTQAVQVEWTKFMLGLFGEHWKWAGLWTGHLLNRPWERTNQAIMLRTMVQGIGKSLWGDFIRDLTGKHGLESSCSRMFAGFNSDMESKTFIMVNELDVKFSNKEGQLNDLLTEERVKIEPKGKDVVDLPNLRRWFFTTNSSSPARLSKGQRRVLVVDPALTLQDATGAWGQWVNGVVAKYRKDEEALGAIREWFDQLWIDEGESWDPTARVPVTEAALEAAEASMTVTQIVAEHLYQWIQAQPEGWASAHPDLRKRDVKVFGDLTALIKANGGYVGQKTLKDDGVVKAYTVFDAWGKLDRLVKPSSGNANVKVEPGPCREQALGLAKEYVKMQELLIK